MQLFDALDFGLARKAAAGKSVSRSTSHLPVGGSGGGSGSGSSGGGVPVSPSPRARQLGGGRGAMAAGSLNQVVDQLRSAGGTKPRERASNLGTGALARFPRGGNGNDASASSTATNKGLLGGIGGSVRSSLANVIGEVAGRRVSLVVGGQLWRHRAREQAALDAPTLEAAERALARLRLDELVRGARASVE